MIATAHTLNDDIAFLRHADGSQAVEHGERLFPRQPFHGSGSWLGFIRVRADEVIHALPQAGREDALGFVQMAELPGRGQGAVRTDAVKALELLGELVGDESACLPDETSQTVAGGLIECHGRTRQGDLLPNDADWLPILKLGTDRL